MRHLAAFALIAALLIPQAASAAVPPGCPATDAEWGPGGGRIRFTIDNTAVPAISTVWLHWIGRDGLPQHKTVSVWPGRVRVTRWLPVSRDPVLGRVFVVGGACAVAP